MPSPIKRFKSAYNAFMGRDPTVSYAYISGSSHRPDRVRYAIQNERSIINSVFNRIAVDCSLIDIKHVRVDEDGNYESTIPSYMNGVLSSSANIDQTGRKLISDLVYSLLDEGCVALVATDATDNPKLTDSYDVLKCRVGKIVEWFPDSVCANVYNESTGHKENIILEKRYTPIIENPFYQIMNEPNSTLQRLIRVLNQLDRINEQNSSGKLDLIIQVPYPIKGDARVEHAKQRKKEIEDQLVNSKYGLAYIDGLEKVIQLNRPLENNLWTQAKELKEELFSDIGFSMSILNNTADENTMQNYYSRIVEPILTTIVEETERKWISRTARTQGQAIRYFRNPFKLVPVMSFAEMCDKLIRNEIMTSNEIRVNIGLPRSKNPRADELSNPNINQSNVEIKEQAEGGDEQSS